MTAREKDLSDKGLGTRFSLFQVKEQPELVKELGPSDFQVLWKTAVKIEGQYSELCRTFESEWVRRESRSHTNTRKP